MCLNRRPAFSARVFKGLAMSPDELFPRQKHEQAPKSEALSNVSESVLLGPGAIAFLEAGVDCMHACIAALEDPWISAFPDIAGSTQPPDSISDP